MTNIFHWYPKNLINVRDKISTFHVFFFYTSSFSSQKTNCWLGRNLGWLADNSEYFDMIQRIWGFIFRGALSFELMQNWTKRPWKKKHPKHKQLFGIQPPKFKIVLSFILSIFVQSWILWIQKFYELYKIVHLLMEPRQAFSGIFCFRMRGWVTWIHFVLAPVRAKLAKLRREMGS